MLRCLARRRPWGVKPKWLRDAYFADEAGDFSFKRKQGASRFFLLCTLTTDDCAIAADLLGFRREQCASEDPDRDKLHATSDSLETRKAIFKILSKCDCRIDATLLEKSKAQPQTRTDDPTFYRYAWYYHFKHVGPRILPKEGRLLITAAALGPKKTKAYTP
jgi:hypothetical protein